MEYEKREFGEDYKSPSQLKEKFYREYYPEGYDEKLAGEAFHLVEDFFKENGGEKASNFFDYIHELYSTKIQRYRMHLDSYDTFEDLYGARIKDEAIWLSTHILNKYGPSSRLNHIFEFREVCSHLKYEHGSKDILPEYEREYLIADILGCSSGIGVDRDLPNYELMKDYRKRKEAWLHPTPKDEPNKIITFEELCLKAEAKK